MSSTTDMANPLWTDPLHRAYLEPSHLHSAIYALLTFCSCKSNFILHNTGAIGNAASFSLILTFDFQDKICSTVFRSAVQLVASYFDKVLYLHEVIGYSPYILTRNCDLNWWISLWDGTQLTLTSLMLCIYYGSLHHKLGLVCHTVYLYSTNMCTALLLICSIVHLHYGPDAYYKNSKGLQNRLIERHIAQSTFAYLGRRKVCMAVS